MLDKPSHLCIDQVHQLQIVYKNQIMTPLTALPLQSVLTEQYPGRQPLVYQLHVYLLSNPFLEFTLGLCESRDRLDELFDLMHHTQLKKITKKTRTYFLEVFNALYILRYSQIQLIELFKSSSR
jgi:hypothetical protein